MLQRSHNEAIKTSLKENIMFNSKLASYPYTNPIGTSYGENLGRAARSFLAALLAIEPARTDVRAAQASDADLDRGATAAELQRLARKFDVIMPNQAAELRYLAGRD